MTILYLTVTIAEYENKGHYGNINSASTVVAVPLDCKTLIYRKGKKSKKSYHYGICRCVYTTCLMNA